ncbi:MAG: hypothetical protein IJW77_03495 [Clostridia bacterium]|nr:hypothetical protein [Clostridia bacterium]
METIYETLCTSIREIGTTYRDAGVQCTAFGTSYLGRTIPGIRLGEGSHRLLYLGGMTADIRSSALLLRFVRDYAEAVRGGMRVAGIDISYLQHTRSITVVPLLNVDGAVLRCDGADEKNPLLPRLLTMTGAEVPQRSTDGNPFADWVCNGRGVDLRCNFDADFTSAMTAARGIGGAGFPGMHPESEPECAAAAKYLRGAAATDLVLVFGDGADEDVGQSGCIAWCGTDHRTRSLAQILARDIDGRGYETDSRVCCGSIGSWYRGLHAGPLLNITLPDTRMQDSGTDSTDTADADDRREYMHALLSDACSAPGDALAHASLVLQYGKLRKMLFHGAVL